MTFSTSHLSTVLKYGGISFIAGAVNHGFFSESRSFWTAALGILFYLMGAWLEMRSQLDGAKTWRDVLGAGIVFSIGIGFFTGGLQHFPDSPERSVWVVPLGFALSIIAMSVMDHSGSNNRKNIWLYGLISVAVVTAGSLVAARMLPSGTLNHSADGHGHSHAPSAPATASGVVTTAQRDIAIDMLDHMRFSPNQIQVKQNETIRFVVKNQGNLRHEWVIGDEQALLAHAQEMKNAKAGSHKHDMANAISLAGGEQGVLTWTFKEAGTLAMACFEPGHYEAGMRGVIQVSPEK